MRSFPLPSILVCVVLVLCACAPAASVAATPSPERTAAIELSDYLSRLSELGFTGSVLVAQKGEILHSRGYGLIHEKDPITPDTIFAIGSNTKPFTAAAILKLQDQGLLKLTDPLRKFFPQVTEDKADITLHQLLTHSSGLDHSGAFNSDFEQVGREDAVDRILSGRLLFKPGNESSYSDYGFILLAAIIEQVSGKTYQNYLREQLFHPSDMTHTGWWGDDPALQGQLMAGTIAGLPEPAWSILGAGGMVSTVTDLYRWHTALEEGKVLSETALQAYSTVQFRVDERGGEGYGWLILDEPGRRMRAHAGGTPQLGHNNVMRWYIDEDLIILASTSHEKWKAEDVAPNLARIVMGLPYSMPPEAVPVDTSILDEYAGRYQLDPNNIFTVSRDGERLLLSGEGQRAFDLLFKTEMGIDVEASQSAVVKYLNSQQGGLLEQWKNRQSQRLGEFEGFRVTGTAPLFGSGEPWTYVSFEFEHGNALTRWIVSPAGALEAALLETQPPYMVFLPESENQFVPFSLNLKSPIQSVTFSTIESGTNSMTISIKSGQLNAPRLTANG